MKKSLLIIVFTVFVLSPKVHAQPCPLVLNYGALGSQLDIMDFGIWTANGMYPPWSIQCSFYGGYGDERYVKFNPPAPGNYRLEVWNNVHSPDNYYTPIEFYFSQTNDTCDLTNFFCPLTLDSSYNYSDQYYTINVPNASSTYDLFIDAGDSMASGFLSVFITCDNPTHVSAINITAHQAEITFSCNCPDTSYIEYGPRGFTPGTGSSAGGGTLISNAHSPELLTGLQPYTMYDYFVRTSCGGYYAANTRYSFRTLYDCAVVPVIGCDSTVIYSNTENYIYGNWQSYPCGPSTYNAVEKMVQFTAPFTGTYGIDYYYRTGYPGPSTLYYKDASGSCDNIGWTCIGSLTYTDEVPITFVWGPLTAGTTYLLMIDGYYNAAWYTQNFRINCLSTSIESPGENFSSDNITLYPNPAAGVFTIEDKNSGKKNITITGSLGNEIVITEFKSVLHDNSQGKTEIDLSAYPKGIYTVKIIEGREVKTFKVVYI